MASVLVLGSINTDLSVRSPRLPKPGETVLGREFTSLPGGKGANQAVAAQRAGAQVRLVAAVGDDDLGRRSLVHLGGEGIDAQHVRVLPGVTSGVALIVVADDGENMIAVDPGANGKLTPADVESLPESVFEPGGVVLVGLEIPVATARAGLARGRQSGMITILNPAPVSADDAADIAALLELVDIVTPNRIEAQALAGLADPAGDQAVAANLLEKGARGVVITLGARGCLAASRSGMIAIPPVPVAVIDTVGAGDAFNGALAVAIAEGQPLQSAARWANHAAALAVTRLGAQAALPNRRDIDQAVAARP